MPTTMVRDLKSNPILNFFAKKILPYAAAVTVFFAVWQLSAYKIGIEFILPTPKATLLKLIEMIPTKAFATATLSSLRRIITGFLFGIAAGTVIGAVSYFIPFFEAFFSPFLKTVRSTPVSSFILLVMLWIKSDTVPIFIAFLMVFPIISQNVLSGLKSTSVHLTEVSKMYGFSFFKKLRVLYLPSALPYFGASCSASLGLAWKAGIAAEVLCVSKNSIGENLYLSNIYDSTALLAWTVAVIILSILTEFIANGLFILIKKLGRFKFQSDASARKIDLEEDGK